MTDGLASYCLIFGLFCFFRIPLLHTCSILGRRCWNGNYMAMDCCMLVFHDVWDALVLAGAWL